MRTWEELKADGSAHYRNTDEVDIQPIDLYRSLGIFRDWAITEICQHALRNTEQVKNGIPVSNRDMRKIIHYAELIMAACGDGEADAKTGGK